MKKLLVILAVLAILLTGAWYGAETWMSRLARDAIASRQDVSAEIMPMRTAGMLGLQLQNVELAGGTGQASFPDAQTYVSWRTPSTLTVDLPDQVTLSPANGAPTNIALSQGRAETTIAATRGFAISHVGLTGRDVMIDEIPVADAIDVTADLTHRGGAAPAGSAASYRVNLSGSGLAFGALPERLDVTGPVQVWLDGVPDRATLDGSAPPPQLTGLQTQNLTFTLGEMTARLIGRFEADAEGFASGQAAIYTTDGPGFVEAAVQAGLLPQDVAGPLQAILTRAAGAPADADPDDPTPESADDDALADEVVTLPPAAAGEVRLPIFMQDGMMRFGPVPLGPAPRIAGF